MMNIAAQAARNLGGFVPNKIFIGGVPITCSEEQFKNHFEAFGPISKVELHALRGFGYITYESVESVDACLEKYEDHYLSKKWVEVKRSIPRDLIDAYEREQRRLHAEAAANDGDKPAAPVEVHPKSEHVAPAPTASSWGPALGAPRRTGPQPSSKDGPGMGGGNLSRIAQLKEMGFSDAVAKRVLGECAWDVNAAIDKLLLSGALPGEEDDSNTAPQADKDVPHVDVEPVPAAPASAAAAAPAAATRTPGDAVGQDTDSQSVPKGDGDTSNGYHAKPSVSGNSAPPAEISKHASEHRDEVGQASAPAEQQFTSDRLDQQTSAMTPEVVEEMIPETVEDASVPVDTSVIDPPIASTTQEIVAEDEVVRDSESRGADAEASAGPVPRKRIERVMKSWSAEDPSQLSVVENEFVSVWVGTDTDNGWIHAEGHEDAARAGWLPLCVLKPLPEGQRWMRAVQQWQAMDESQCSAQNGAMVIVWVSSRTKEGWTYAESEQGGEMKPGWLPVFCLAWNEE